jgi:hypothetical protein
MRTRRQFRPVFEFLPGRIAPSCAFDVSDPGDSSSTPGDTTTIVDPMDGSSGPSTAPSSGGSLLRTGSWTTTGSSGTALC